MVDAHAHTIAKALAAGSIVTCAVNQHLMLTELF